MLKRKNLDSEEKYKSIVEIVVSNNSKNNKIYPPVYACNTLIKINDTGIPETVGIYSDLSDKLYVKNDELSNELIQKAKIVLDTKNDLATINTKDCCAGSTAYIIETKEVYMLNSKKEWVLQ